MRITLLVFLFALLFSCSNKKTSDNNRYKKYDDYIVSNKLEETNKVNGFFFRGWNSLDNKHLILNGSHNKAYILTLAYYCNDLDFSSSILLDQSINTSLSSKFDSIIIPNQQIPQKCRISTIHKINKEQRNELTGLRKQSKK